MRFLIRFTLNEIVTYIYCILKTYLMNRVYDFLYGENTLQHRLILLLVYFYCSFYMHYYLESIISVSN